MVMQNYLQFEPKINDFGDKYHLPDDEVYSNIDEAVRNIRRKYRHYNDYLKAIRTIEEYMEALVETYGGIRNFKMAMQLKTVREFIPPIPRFRNTEENRLLAKYGTMISEQVFDVDYDLSEEHVARVECASQTSGNGMDVVESKRVYLPFDVDKKTSSILNNEDAIVKELETLKNFSRNSCTSKKKRKKSSHNLIKEAKRRKKLLEKASEPQTVTEAIIDYNNDVMGLSRDDEAEGTIIYKGVMIPKVEMENINVMSTLKRAGLMASNDLSSVNSKEIRKMIKKENATEKAKSKKKKKHEVDPEEMDEFLDAYNESENFGTNFKAFEKEMLAFTSSGIE